MRKGSRMKKVLVIGCCGAGKSTFSKTLQSILKLELIHLDQYYHKPNWEEPEKEQWEGIVNNLVQKPSWIMDGNYKGTLERLNSVKKHKKVYVFKTDKEADLFLSQIT